MLNALRFALSVRLVETMVADIDLLILKALKQ